MYFTISCTSFMLFLYGARSDNYHQLELKISDLESHSLALEQKQAAVLSSILSRIQSQEQRIQSQEQKIQSQDQKIQSQDQKIQSQNQSLQSYEQKMQSQEHMIQELKAELENATKTDCSSTSSSGDQPVVFEARASHDLGARRRIHFDKIITNVGGAYSSDNDVFTAPRNGTYQIWFNVNLNLYYSGGQGPVLRVTGGADATVYGSYIAPEQKLNRSSYQYKVLQGVLAVSLLQGDPVYLTLNPQDLYPYTKVIAPSTFGGVFLGDM